MRKLFIVLAMSGLLLGVGDVPISADTHAPSTQFADLQCGDQLLSFVSPGFHALAGQEVNSTRVGVVLMITAGDEVVFRSPTLDHLPSGLITTCTGGGLTFTFLLPALK